LSDSDSFIQEVSEEVRRDRMFRLWKRFAPFVIGVVVAVVAATAVLSWLDHRAEEAAREAGGVLLRASDASDPARRAEALLAGADALDDGPALLARLRAAAELASAGDAASRDEAARLFSEVAATADAAPVLADFAALRGAALALAQGDQAAAEPLLSGLASGEGPFRPLALEMRAALYLQRGDRDAARADAQAAAADPAATEALRARLAELLAALGQA
jgi:hypothetical protein